MISQDPQISFDLRETCFAKRSGMPPKQYPFVSLKTGIVMKLGTLAMIGAVCGVLALPAAAQTTQTTPTKPSPALTTTTKPVPATTTKPVPATPTARPGASTSAPLVDINSASSADLDKLPGIGPSRADAIVKNRPYKGKDDLMSRHIIPPNVYNGIKDKIIAKQG